MTDLDKAKRGLILRAYQRGIKTPRDFMILKNEISTEFKIDSIPNYGLMAIYDGLVKKGEIKKKPEIEKLLRKAKMRTLSGVAVVSVLTKEYGCPGNCLYCPNEKGMPKSYLSNEPAVMRAILADFDPYRQVTMRLEALKKAGHSIDKIELIIMGGSFNALPEKYQYEFVTRCFEACNEHRIKYKVLSIKESKTPHNTYYLIHNTKNSLEKIKRQLRKEQERNETARSRVIGLTLETRPDLINESELKKFREMGCTRIEIGVQSIYDDVLKKNRRGHSATEIVKATKLMKDFGFKVSYHMMPGLYGSTLKKDLEMFKTIFGVKPLNSLDSARDKSLKPSDLQPDQIKIYPCVVVKGTDLYKLWKGKKYKPYTDRQLIKLICDIKKIVPPYVRISRLIRDIPEESIEAGNKITNLRQVIANHSQKDGWACQCIRCREIRDNKLKNQEAKKLKLDLIEYEASGGREVFLQYIDNHSHLYALLRLRLADRAIIREVHTYGESLPVGAIPATSAGRHESPDTQHEGLGKRLISQAEKIAKSAGYKKIAVISGIGARGYYKKLGYKLEGTYMIKDLEPKVI